MSGQDRYAYSFDPNDTSTAARVVRLVGEGKRVLELGTSSGSMTRVLKDALHCAVVGVEIDPEDAAAAAPWCERMVVGDLGQLDFSATFPDDQFDVVLAADVLEHLVDPWRCLEQVRPLLRPGGYLVVSVPNIAHNGVIACLLAGAFPYQEKGLLDRTHLRFFARGNLEDLMVSSGYVPAHWERFDVPEHLTEMNLYWAALPDAVRTALSGAADGRTYQYVVKAYPATEAGYLGALKSDQVQKSVRLSALEADFSRTAADLAEHRKAFGEAREIIARLERDIATRDERIKSFEAAERRLREALEAQGRSAQEKIAMLEQQMMETRSAVEGLRQPPPPPPPPPGLLRRAYRWLLGA